MHDSYTYSPSSANQADDRIGTVLSIAGLVAWLTAMLLAVSGPMLGIEVPPLLIVGMVVFSGAFSVLSMPKLIGLGKHKRDDQIYHT
jgi:ABC-type antimicrobial peptide transport system permease subunit